MEYTTFKTRDVANRGKIEQITYETVNAKGETLHKYANVYLPYGYSADKQYNILYLMHGGGGNPDAWLDSCTLKNMLDLSIDDGRIEPLIVVTPTYYTEPRTGFNVEWERDQVIWFQKELAADLIPAVEGRYATFAADTTAEGLKASRKHRAFSGFSMGGSTTWFAFLYNLDAIAGFVPLSGDCWVIERMGGSSHPEETADALREAVLAKGYTKEDIFVYAVTGTDDIAYPHLYTQCRAMEKRNDVFVKGENFLTEFPPHMVHSYPDVCQHLYNALPYLFK